MSRSFKKHCGDGICSGYGDKYCRTIYHRAERRKVKNLLKEQLKLSTSTWQPVEPCSGFGDVCNLDDWWLENPSEYILNYDEENSKPGFDYTSDCFNCMWAYWDKDYDCSKEPWEDIILNKVDRSLKFSDKWSWASDGGSYWQEDSSTARKDFDKEIFGLCSSTQKTSWETYQTEVLKYKVNPYQKFWKVTLYYKTIQEEIWDGHSFKNEIVTEKKLEVPYTKGFINIKQDGWYKCSAHKKRNYRNRQVHSDWSLLDFLLYRNIIPRDFTKPEDFINWLRENQETIIKKWLKRKFSK